LILLIVSFRSYKSENLFDHDGRLLPELKALVPPKHLRMGNHPLTNPILRPLVLPDFEAYGVDVTPASRGAKTASDTGVFGVWLRDVVQQNEKTRNFRIFGPDETASNRLQAVFEVTNKQWMAEINQYDDTLAQEGRVMEMLSEHQCEGWLEGYLLTGRHGLLSSYEAFIHIITSMVNQHQKYVLFLAHN
jgi:xylulose-5-phosphate/fructose-6-phosphate phosphoketolase